MNRLFLVDPVAANMHGHNMPALIYFRSYFRNIFNDVSCYASSSSPAFHSEKNSISPFFSLMYGELLGVEKTNAAHLSHADRINLAIHDFLSFFSDKGPFESDYLMLPSADFYSIAALHAIATRWGIPQGLFIRLRLIGVLENVTKDGANLSAETIANLRGLMHASPETSISAETAPYCAVLAKATASEVHLTPYPPFGELRPFPTGSKFKIFAGGAGRLDKGFLRILDIVDATVRKVGLDSVEFIVQDLPTAQSQSNIDYCRRLLCHPSVRLESSYLSSEKLLELSIEAAAYIMPYDPNTYKLRGSAMLMEALAIGRRVISQSGCGFSHYIDHYNAGYICETNEDFANAIVDLIASGVGANESLCHTSNKRFALDTISSYREWLK